MRVTCDFGLGEGEEEGMDMAGGEEGLCVESEPAALVVDGLGGGE
jgi:hypothetical protein